MENKEILNFIKEYISHNLKDLKVYDFNEDNKIYFCIQDNTYKYTDFDFPEIFRELKTLLKLNFNKSFIYWQDGFYRIINNREIKPRKLHFSNFSKR